MKEKKLRSGRAKLVSTLCAALADGCNGLVFSIPMPPWPGGWSETVDGFGNDVDEGKVDMADGTAEERFTCLEARLAQVEEKNRLLEQVTIP